MEGKTTRPEGAKDIRSLLRRSTHGLATTLYRPFGAGHFFSGNLGLKPQAESFRPFGTTTSFHVPSGFGPHRRLVHSPIRRVAIQ